MALKLQTAPTVPCITTAEAKAHLRVTANSENALIDALVLAATQDAEHLMQRAIMPQAWLLTLDAFASCVKLQRPPVVAVTSVNYAAADTGTVTLLPNTEYQLDLGSDLFARLVPAYGKTWPATRAQIAAVQILFTCGWTNAATVPAVIRVTCNYQRGLHGGVRVISILREFVGPDEKNPDAEIYSKSTDWLVTHYEA